MKGNILENKFHYLRILQITYKITVNYTNAFDFAVLNKKIILYQNTDRYYTYVCTMTKNILPLS